jgi:hypothetical protein
MLLKTIYACSIIFLSLFGKGKFYTAFVMASEMFLLWEEIEPWEQENAVKVYELVQHLAWTVGWPIDGLSREQKGRFVHTCLVAQIWKRAPQGEGMALNDWNHLPGWQQVVYADLFETIEWYQEIADVPQFVSFFKKL